MKLLSLTCPVCSAPFQRTVGSYNRSLRNVGKCCCSIKCLHAKPKKNCEQCGTETKNPRFCSTSCSATYLNRQKPKRAKKEKFCSGCGRPSVRNSKRCKFCRNKKNYGILSLSDVKQISGSRNSYDTTVRLHSRFIAKEAGLLDFCSRCGYTLCVECCHIKAVSEFPLTATLNEVNDVNNLIGLCPNHHWELDHGHWNVVPSVGFQPTASSL